VSSPDPVPAPAPDLTALLKRLEKVERQRHVLLFVACLAFAFSGANLALSYARSGPPQPAAVEAVRFVLKDAAGREQGTIGVNDNPPGFAFCDAAGNKWASLGQANGGGGLLHFYDRSGKKRIGLGALPAGGFIGLSSDNEKSLLMMGAPHNKPTFVIYDQNLATSLTLDDAGLTLYEGEWNRRAWLGKSDGGALLGFYDANAKPRVVMGMLKDGPSLVITAENRAVLFSRP
jgi:hypothetical protein